MPRTSPFGQQANEWIEQDRPAERTTEALLPVTIGVLPTWAYTDDIGGCWQAEMCVLGRNFWECDHYHATADEAFDCGEAVLQEIVRRLLAGRGGEMKGADSAD